MEVVNREEGVIEAHAPEQEALPQEVKKKRVDGIVINDPYLGGWLIHRGFQSLKVNHPGYHKQLEKMESFQQALSYIIEQRIVNEISGEMTLDEYNQAVNKIHAEIEKSSAIIKKQSQEVQQ